MTNDTAVMVDIETLGKTVDAPVLSIGAVIFNNRTGFIDYENALDLRISPEDALRHGRPDASTIKWWMEQSPEAQTAAFGGEMSSEQATMQLMHWYVTRADGAPVWANGSDFDIAILGNLFRKVCPAAFAWPLQYNAARDMRTLKDTCRQLGVEVHNPPDREGHVALEDAIWQAQWVCNAYAELRGRHQVPKKQDDEPTLVVYRDEMSRKEAREDGRPNVRRVAATCITQLLGTPPVSRIIVMPGVDLGRDTGDGTVETVLRRRQRTFRPEDREFIIL